MIKMNIALEKTALANFNKGIRLCFHENDNGTRLLLEGILKDEEAHLREYETMAEGIEKFGDAYILQQFL